MYRPRIALNIVLICALAAAPAVVFFTRIARAEEKKQKTELHHKMEAMDEAMKKLKRTLKKSSENEESVKLCEEVVEAATACRDMTPSRAKDMPEADRKKFIEEYRKSMTHLIETVQEMKKAVAAGDNAKAMALHKALKDQREDGHDKFMEDSDKGSEKKGDK